MTRKYDTVICAPCSANILVQFMNIAKEIETLPQKKNTALEPFVSVSLFLNKKARYMLNLTQCYRDLCLSVEFPTRFKLGNET